jgi:hypothetical protein
LAKASDCFIPIDEIGQADGREIATMVYMTAKAVGKMRMRRDTTAHAPLTWLTLIMSPGEIPIEVKLAEDRHRARAGRLVRLLADAPTTQSPRASTFVVAALAKRSMPKHAEGNHLAKMVKAKNFSGRGVDDEDGVEP